MRHPAEKAIEAFARADGADPRLAVLVRAGARFERGILVERPDQEAA
ncbi:hypothetical protein STENM327S_02942 [Streptomyces tendae]